MENKKIILASKSPRRKKILKDMGLEFEIIPPDGTEILDGLEFSYKKIENLASSKVENVAKKCDSNVLIIGADTVVVFENKIMNKPKDKSEAFLMLKTLSGGKHTVVTAICVKDILSDKSKTISVTSYVEFNHLSNEMINNYIDTYLPLDKAGSYGIQELPETWIKNISGSFENIIGLCPLALKNILLEFSL